MPNQPADSSNEFEWPPREEVLAGQVFKLGDPLPRPSPPPAASAAPARELLEEPHVVLRRTLEARADAQPRTARTPERRPPLWPGLAAFTATRRNRLQAWVRSRLLPFALAALALIVVLQAVYILRVQRDASTPASNVAAAVEPPAASEIARAPDRSTSRTPAPAAKTAPAATSGRRAPVAAAGARMVIRSNPSGARVSLDGRPRGVTPLTLTGIKPGEYRLTLARDGIEVQQTVSVVDANATISVLAPMQPTGPVSGWLALQSPIVLDVYEDGALLGTSRSSRILLPAGLHSLQFVNEQLGFRDVRDVQVEPGEVLQVPVELPQANVLVNATPWAEVYIDGKHVGQTPIGRLSLPIGTYDIVFRHPELGEKKRTTIVKAGAPTRITMDLRRP